MIEKNFYQLDEKVRYIIGLTNRKVFHTYGFLAILVDYSIQMIYGILVHQILVETEERILD